MTRTLVLAIGSKHQARHDPDHASDGYDREASVLGLLDNAAPELVEKMCSKREEVRKWIKGDEFEWCGRPLRAHENNLQLVSGEDFGGPRDSGARYMPAVFRHMGGMYETWENEDRISMCEPPSHLRFLLVNGLYSLTTPEEPMQISNSPAKVVERARMVWNGDDSFLTQVILAYRSYWRFDRVLDLTATDVRRRLVDWEWLRDELKGQVRHAFSRNFVGADALRPMGLFVRDYLLKGGDGEAWLDEAFETGAVSVETDEIDLDFLPAAGVHPLGLTDPGEFIETRESASSEPGEPSEREVRTTGRSPGQADWHVGLAAGFGAELPDALRAGGAELVGEFLRVIAEIGGSPRPQERKGVEKLTEAGLKGCWSWRLRDNFRLVWEPSTAGEVRLLSIGRHTDTDDCVYKRAKKRRRSR